MWVKLASVFGALAFPLLCVYCVSRNGPIIQSELHAATSAALQATGATGVSVLVDGRDVTLSGAVENGAARQKAFETAAAVYGVRSVAGELTFAPIAAVVQTKLNEILRKKIEFEPNKDVLLPSSIPVLEECLAVLREAPSIKVAIGGHTDSSGLASANRALSERRAKAVANWLAGKGVSADRLSAVGYGSDKPIAPDATPEGRAANRRVEIIARGATPGAGR